MGEKFSGHIHIHAGNLDGWCMACPEEERHHSLEMLLHHNSYATIIERLQLLVNLNRRRNPHFAHVARSDEQWLRHHREVTERGEHENAELDREIRRGIHASHRGVGIVWGIIGLIALVTIVVAFVAYPQYFLAVLIVLAALAILALYRGNPYGISAAVGLIVLAAILALFGQQSTLTLTLAGKTLPLLLPAAHGALSAVVAA